MQPYIIIYMIVCMHFIVYMYNNYVHMHVCANLTLFTFINSSQAVSILGLMNQHVDIICMQLLQDK